MIMRLYSLHDEVLGVFNKTFAQVNDAAAIRGLRDVMRRDEHVQKNAGDYVLYHVGQFEDSTGEVVPNAPEIVIRCDTLLKELEQ